jgi:hypothetical protein
VRPLITLERARELLRYDAAAGNLYWLVNRGRSAKAGQVAGYSTCGRVGVKIDGRMYQASRIAWLLHYGVHPHKLIDHIDGNPANNRIENLRDVTHQVNCENKRGPQSNNKLGFMGVVPEQLKFQAFIRTNGRTIYLGSYKSPEEAHQVYLAAKRKIHEGCTI